MALSDRSKINKLICSSVSLNWWMLRDALSVSRSSDWRHHQRRAGDRPFIHRQSQTQSAAPYSKPTHLALRLTMRAGSNGLQQILIHIKMRVNQFNTKQNLYKANNYPGSRHLLTNQKHVLNILLLIAERYFLVYVSSHSPACYNFQHRL